MVCLYVDGLIFTRNNLEIIAEFREVMIKQFEMTNMSLMSFFLETFISQKKYARDSLKKFKMDTMNQISNLKYHFKMGIASTLIANIISYSS